MRKQEPRVITRREILALLLCSALPCSLGLGACSKRRYKRPAGDLDLGTVRSLLYRKIHIRPRAVMVFRDEKGWSAMSTRCTYKGCDLSFQDEGFLCPCCKTRYDIKGRILVGPAPDPLPWIKMSYKKGHLAANPGMIVTPSERFTTPEIEAAIKKLKKQIHEEKVSDEIAIPQILLGEGTGETGIMFVEEDPTLIEDLEMIR